VQRCALRRRHHGLALRTSRIPQSGLGRRGSGVHVAAQPQHRVGSHRVGDALLLLHPLPPRHEGAGHQPRHSAVEVAIPALHGLVRLHRCHHHYFCRRFPCVPQGQLVDCRLYRVV
ncbi:hypothetical protein BN1708_019748, partial [Verticillium longisporum]